MQVAVLTSQLHFCKSGAGPGSLNHHLDKCNLLLIVRLKASPRPLSEHSPHHITLKYMKIKDSNVGFLSAILRLCLVWNDDGMYLYCKYFLSLGFRFQ